MTKWVENKIRLFGPKEDIKNILDFLGTNDKETDFDFNKIVKMPKILEETTSSVQKESIYAFVTDNLKYDISYEKYIAVISMLKERLNLGIFNKERFEQFVKRIKEADEKCRKNWFEDGKHSILGYLTTGHSNWYDWRIDNWGTKWDRNNLMFQFDSTSTPIYEFRTPWDTPKPIFINLSKMFPSIKIEVTYSDEDFGSNNHGRYSVINGNVNDYDCLNCDEIIADTWGDEALEIWKENMAD